MCNEFNISIKDNQFIVESEDNTKNMKCVYYINYDSDYNYLYNYIKVNGYININVNNNLELINISTMVKNYSFEYYIFDGDFNSSEDVEEYYLGYNCLEFYKYYFYD